MHHSIRFCLIVYHLLDHFQLNLDEIKIQHTNEGCVQIYVLKHVLLLLSRHFYRMIPHFTIRNTEIKLLIMHKPMRHILDQDLSSLVVYAFIAK